MILFFLAVIGLSLYSLWKGEEGLVWGVVALAAGFLLPNLSV
jgi:uncharacterized membrane protein (DUF441 family)